VVVLQGDHVLTVATPGAPPVELVAGRGLRFEVQGQPGITAEFELDEDGSVVRLVAQPLGIFHPQPPGLSDPAEAQVTAGRIP
jgi:hypothetical protein